MHNFKSKLEEISDILYFIVLICFTILVFVLVIVSIIVICKEFLF